MRKKIIFTVLAAVSLFSAAKTEAGVAGGVILGVPAAFSLRIDQTVVLGLGGFYDGMLIMADHWIIHKPIPATSIELNWYLGIGGELGVWYNNYWDHHHYYYGDYHGNFSMGVRIPVGLELPFEQRREAFVEIVPVMNVFPFGPYGNGGIGLRYKF